MDNQEYEIKRDILVQAGRVALEFLRANPCKTVDEASANYNKIFKDVYQGMIDIIGK